MNTALIVIDLQKDFFKQEPLLSKKDNLVAKTNELVSIARVNGVPVIWSFLKFKADNSDAFPSLVKAGIKYNLEGTDGWELLDELDVRESDIQLEKKRYSVFFKTNLDEFIEANNIERLIFCGINTHACVRVSVVDAYQRDLEVILSSDCTDSYDSARHETSWSYLTAMLTETIANIALPLTNEKIKELLSR